MRCSFWAYRGKASPVPGQIHQSNTISWGSVRESSQHSQADTAPIHNVYHSVWLAVSQPGQCPVSRASPPSPVMWCSLDTAKEGHMAVLWALCRPHCWSLSDSPCQYVFHVSLQGAGKRSGGDVSVKQRNHCAGMNPAGQGVKILGPITDKKYLFDQLESGIWTFLEAHQCAFL